MPDLTISEKNPQGTMQVIWVLEVGFSETYKELKKDMELIFKAEGRENIQCALVKITETPKYRCPISHEEEIDWKHPTPKDFHSQAEYGPISYEDRQWVGTISNIFWETWKFDDKTNKIRQIGKRMVIHPASPTSKKPLPLIRFDQILSNPPANISSPLLDWDIFEVR